MVVVWGHTKFTSIRQRKGLRIGQVRLWGWESDQVCVFKGKLWRSSDKV